MIDLERIGADARAASRTLAVLDTAKKNQVLMAAADALDREENQAAILRGNAEDLAIADQNQMPAGLRDQHIHVLVHLHEAVRRLVIRRLDQLQYVRVNAGGLDGAPEDLRNREVRVDRI